MAYYTKQDTVNRVKGKLDLPNKPGWVSKSRTASSCSIDQSGGTVSSPYYQDGRQVPAARTYTKG